MMRLLPTRHLVLATALLLMLGVLVFTGVYAMPDKEGAKVVSPANASGAPARPQTARYGYRVVKLYPHDRRLFTQGMVYEDGFLYEGTGLYGQSAIYKRDLQTGKTVKMLRLPEKYFGEGITLFGDKLIQLTWQSKVGFVYTKDTFTPLREFKYSGEGWGLTHDGKRLILSDGTSILRFLDPNTFAETGRIQVRDQGRPVELINELEFIPADPPPGSGGAGEGARPEGRGTGEEGTGARQEHPTPHAPQAPPPSSGLIYANIWRTQQIAMIDPKTGRVTGWIDLAGLFPPPTSDEDDRVLNGIAWLPQTQHLLVTGKLWPRMYEIELVPEPPH